MTGTSATIVGLGNMGAAMARTLARKGFAVTGCDTRPERAAQLPAGARFATTIGDAVRGAATVVLSLPSSREVEAIAPALLAGLAPGAAVVDTTTADPESTRRLEPDFAARGIGFVDAPVSGGAAGAESGTLGIMVGGREATIAQVRPLLEAMAARIVVVGGPGAGHVAKLVNNLLIAQHLITTAEAVKLARRAGLDAGQLLGAVNASSGRSGASETCFPKWVLPGSYDSGFTMGLMRKDLGLALSLAGKLGVNLALGSVAGRLWSESRDAVPDGEDFNRIAQYVEEKS
ncbi:MAG: NAD(P)-dependent oxidoreductase [Alphaproteobacteria bacterium]|nr:NAD(P)-dependent oxidoreductase [Alphaproteobacteria bacterium]